MFYRLPRVVEVAQLSPSAIYKLVQEGRFPQQLRISHRVAVWREREVTDWCEFVSENGRYPDNLAEMAAATERRISAELEARLQ